MLNWASRCQIKGRIVKLSVQTWNRRSRHQIERPDIEPWLGTSNSAYRRKLKAPGVKLLLLMPLEPPNVKLRLQTSNRGYRHYIEARGCRRQHRIPTGNLLDWFGDRLCDRTCDRICDRNMLDGSNESQVPLLEIIHQHRSNCCKEPTLVYIRFTTARELKLKGF